jgi:hypothetical protein
MKTISVKLAIKMMLGLVCVLGVFSCNQGDYKENLSLEETGVTSTYEVIEEETPIASLQNDATLVKVPANLKIIKSANARYKVKNVKSATAQIKDIATKYDAYVSDLRFQNNLYQIENRFTIKVPQQYFDAILDSIGGVVDFVEYENITTQDVTEEYIDLQSRLQTKLEVKGRYEEVLRKNAKTVKDILDTEDKLRVIQEEIEAAQGRLKYLSSKVSYSTIQIDLYETVNYKEEPENYTRTFLSKTKDGFAFGWNIIETIVLAMIHIWPLLLFGIIVVVLIRGRLKK